MRAYIKLMESVDKFLVILGTLATIGMTFFMVLTVVNRFLLGGMIPGCEEWSRICFCWTLFFMVGCCANVGNFATIGLLRNALPKKGQIAHYVICQLVGIVLSYVLIRYGIWYCMNCWGQYYGSLKISSVIFMYSAMPIGGTFLALNCVNNIFRAIVMVRGGEVVAELSDEVDLSLDINVDEVEEFKRNAEERGEE